jgi:hypothetical protein
LVDVTRTRQQAAQIEPERAAAASPPVPYSWGAVQALQRSAGNQAVARMLGAARSLAREPAAEAAPALGPVGQGAADAIAALDLTVTRVKQAIAERDGSGRIPQAMTAALARFFPGFEPAFLDDILARLQPMSGWVPGIDVRRVVPPATNPPHPDAAAIELVRLALVAKDPDVPAFTMIRRTVPAMVPGPDYVVVLPAWDAEPALQATRLLHEYFHFAFVGVGHSANPLNSAFAWQGFVSIVGELEIGPKLRALFPPRAD